MSNKTAKCARLLIPRRAYLWIFAALVAFVLPSTAPGQSVLQLREWKVDGLDRTALVYVPPQAKAKDTPVVFAFHGHGGSATNSAKMFRIHEVWPEAIAVYMQGLKTPGRLTDPEGKRPGWQHAVGDQADRDLKFFDAVWTTLQKDYRVDKKRVYATGHSNGGAFTIVVWAARGDLFAAVAPSAEVPAKTFPLLKPKPVMHISGRKDPLVKFEWQEEAVKRIRELNQCGEGEPWAENCTLYPSKIGAPVIAFFHPGGHSVPSDAPALIVKFFKEHPLK